MRKKIYFDYAATTPAALEVRRAMAPYFAEKFGNPGSLHFFGQEAMAAVDRSRQIIAQALGANFREIIFTGSATEANNLAIRGAMKAYQRQSAKIGVNRRPRFIISAIEHESVLDTAKSLEKEGAEVICLPVSRAGLIDLAELKKSLNERTVLVSVMLANNEIGAIQPIREIVETVGDWKAKRESSGGYPLVHTDAVQAFQFLDCDVKKLGADLMTLSAHKIYGPKGVGCLYARSGFKNLKPVITGGGQEFGLRSGTENVANIAGFGRAVELISHSRESENKRIRALRDYFWRGLKKIFPQAELNPRAAAEISPERRLMFLPNILNVYFPGQKSEDLLIKMDQEGIAVSSGSACSVRSSKPSHVLKALALPTERILGSLRFSFGKLTTKKEIADSLNRLKKIK